MLEKIRHFAISISGKILTFYLGLFGLAGVIACKYGVPESRYHVQMNIKSADSLKPVSGLYAEGKMEGITAGGFSDNNGNCDFYLVTEEPAASSINLSITDVDSSLNGCFSELDTILPLQPGSNSFILLVKRK